VQLIFIVMPWLDPGVSGGAPSWSGWMPTRCTLGSSAGSSPLAPRTL